MDFINWCNDWSEENWSESLYVACAWLRIDVVRVLLREYNFSAYRLERLIGVTASSLKYPKSDDRNVSAQERLLTAEEDSKVQANIIELLISARMRLDQGEEFDEVALLNKYTGRVAISPFTISALRLLLEKGVDPNRQNRIGFTPLHDAVQLYRQIGKCNERAVQLLLAHGAKADIPDEEGRTAMDYAEKQFGQDSDVVHMLQKFHS